MRQGMQPSRRTDTFHESRHPALLHRGRHRAPSRDGEIVIVVDDEDRENEGDLIMAAEQVTPEKIAFMVRHTSGVICAADDRRARSTSSTCR